MVILRHSSKLQPITAEKSRQQELKAAHHKASTLRQQSGTLEVLSPFLPLFL